MASDTPAQPSSPSPPAPVRSRRRMWALLGVAILLGVVTPVVVAMGGGAYVPIRGISRGVVERDGDHLQLWILRMDFPTGSRAMWFEKGRIYNRPGVGPPGGSSAAVANWSFAIGTRADKRYAKGEVDLPADVRARIGESPGKMGGADGRTIVGVWSEAVDRRGWPWPAMEGRVVGTMNGAAESVYVAEAGFVLPASTSVFGFGRSRGMYGGSEALADLRILPTRPLWPGLLADALCTAAIWWCVLRLTSAAWSGVVARRRKLAGCCRKCGYDRVGLDARVCPECGTGLGS